MNNSEATTMNPEDHAKEFISNNCYFDGYFALQQYREECKREKVTPVKIPVFFYLFLKSQGYQI